MDPDRWRRVEELCHAAASCAPSERGTFLDEACGDDVEIRREVESLLGEESRVESFLATAAWRALALAPGTRLGPHEILGLIGAGGMGEVYKARDTHLDRLVAIKVLKPELAAVLGAERFLREIRLTAHFDHPHIVPLLDSGETEGLLYYVMPYVEGESLRDRIVRERQLALDDALKIAREVADALAYAHRVGVVHCDVKPENILLAEGHARVADFGIARAMTAAAGDTPTATGVTVGTPAYMSPEQASGLEVDPRSDVYSLACITYEMLAGEPPFTGPTREAILARKSRGAVPGLRVVRPTVRLGVEAAIARALAAVPADRFATAWQFVEALERGRQTVAPWSPVTGGPLRRRLLVAAGAVALAATAGWWGLIGRGPGPVAPRIASLAVLPCANLSGDSGQEYFAEGIHDAVIGELARLGVFDKVISRTTAMRYRNTTQSMPVIARELGVDALVECAVLRADGRVRITVQLIEGSTDRHLWADSYDRDITNVLGLQRDVAGAVARQMAGSLSPVARQRLEVVSAADRRPDPNPQAYDAYLRGRYYMGQASGGGQQLPLAIRRFEQAIAKDPAFAPAHAALAVAYDWSAFFEPELRERAKVAARHAVELDPALAEAHVAIALVKMNADWDWEGSEAAFRKALELDPNSSTGHQWYAQLLRQTARLDEALREALRAQDLDPLSLTVRTGVGWVLYNQRRYDEALEVWQRVLELEPEFGLAIYNRGLVYWAKGMGPEVVASAQGARAARLPIDEDSTELLLAVGYALSGERDRAMALLGELEARFGGARPTMLAGLYHALGADQVALGLLERAFEMRDPWLPNDTSEPVFDRLRDHPRFKALRARMRLP